MMQQADFTESMFRAAPDDERLGLMLGLLDGRGWLNARQIKQRLGFNDRTIRMLAEASDGEIISGQKGYKLTYQATPEEVRHAAAWLESQALKMSLRARVIRKVWHRAGHVTI